MTKRCNCDPLGEGWICAWSLRAAAWDKIKADHERITGMSMEYEIMVEDDYEYVAARYGIDLSSMPPRPVPLGGCRYG